MSRANSNTTVEIYLAIRRPTTGALTIVSDAAEAAFRMEEAISELCSCSGDLSLGYEGASVKPNIAAVRCPDGELARRLGISPGRLGQTQILCISAEVPFEWFETLEQDSQGRISAAYEAQTFARIDLPKHIFDLVMMTNIGRIGALDISSSCVLQDGTWVPYSHFPSMEIGALRRGASIANAFGWPGLKTLNVRTVWGWARSRMDLFDGFDGTALGRAICAYSHLFGTRTADEPMQLLWSMIGLEALYVKGDSNIASQLREKSQLLLGPMTDYRKKLTQLYDFRSRLVHGSLDFCPLLLLGDARDEVGDYDASLLDSIAFACAILTATLQEIINRDWSGLSFEYSVGDIGTTR